MAIFSNPLFASYSVYAHNASIIPKQPQLYRDVEPSNGLESGAGIVRGKSHDRQTVGRTKTVGEETAAGVDHLIQLPTHRQRQYRVHGAAVQPQPTCPHQKHAVSFSIEKKFPVFL